jgi:predicted lipoprotein with Yx(FWY)xxD motif
MRLLPKLYWALSIGVALGLVTTAAYISHAPVVTDAHAAAKDSKSGKSAGSFKYWQSPDSPDREAYREEPMPPGFKVLVADLEGPVFTTAEGRTLYTWPLRSLRNGATGDREGKPSACTNEVLRVTAGLMSPYPPGLVLPDLDTRPSCVALWPPLLAPKDAKKIGKWSVIQREDGADQWAYDGYPVYTSVLDQQAGDVRGGTKLNSSNDGGVVRKPIGPATAVPPEFEVVPATSGRLLVNRERYSVYMWDGDEPNVSNCHDECLNDWTPVRAPQVVTERDGWTIIKRAPGINQWAFRGKPLYTYNYDRGLRSFWGADVPGWHNVYTQRTLPPPEGFTVQDVEAGGEVLADSRGRTIYLYNCRDDSFAQLACDNPDSTQAYRLAICGDGDAKLCQQTFPYVPAPAGAKGVGRLWSVMAIDPDTGRRAAPGQKALNVWAYRDRPVYTFAGDDQPGVTNGDGYGEFTGRRNGFKAFVFRDIFQGNAFRP